MTRAFAELGNNCPIIVARTADGRGLLCSLASRHDGGHLLSGDHPLVSFAAADASRLGGVDCVVRAGSIRALTDSERAELRAHVEAALAMRPPTEAAERAGAQVGSADGATSYDGLRFGAADPQLTRDEWRLVVDLRSGRSTLWAAPSDRAARDWYFRRNGDLVYPLSPSEVRAAESLLARKLITAHGQGFVLSGALAAWSAP